MYCPIENNLYDTITMAHGGGGKLTSQLIEQVFLKEFNNDILATMHDASVVEVNSNQIAVTTDSYIIKPVFFPGGDIGKLSICGTINDLLMSGALPKYITTSFIIEEGFKIDDLQKIAKSIACIAKENNIKIIAGDTKVVDRFSSDPNVFINTTGVGELDNSIKINPSNIKDQDIIIVSGDIGRHSIAVMASRQGLEFESDIISDCMSLKFIVMQLINKFGSSIHCMRDLTRGGLATVCIELSEQSGFDFTLQDQAIPISQPVHAACELLGLNPLYCANEGRFTIIVEPSIAEQVLVILNSYNKNNNLPKAAIIGKVTKSNCNPQCKLVTAYGSSYKLSKQSGEQLPRIC